MAYLRGKSEHTILQARWRDDGDGGWQRYQDDIDDGSRQRHVVDVG